MAFGHHLLDDHLRSEGGRGARSNLGLAQGQQAKDAVQEFEFRDNKPLRYGYLLHEAPKDDKERWALYTCTFGESGHVLMAIYFDRQSDLETAKGFGSASQTVPNEWA